MTETPVTLEELLITRETLIAGMVGKMPARHRLFLLSFKQGEPDWSLLDLPGAERLPAVRWRLENLAKLTAPKRRTLIERLTEVLGHRE